MLETPEAGIIRSEQVHQVYCAVCGCTFMDGGRPKVVFVKEIRALGWKTCKSKWHCPDCIDSEGE